MVIYDLYICEYSEKNINLKGHIWFSWRARGWE